MSDWGQLCLCRPKIPRHLCQIIYIFPPSHFSLSILSQKYQESWFLSEEKCANEAQPSIIWFWTKHRAKSWALSWDHEVIQTSASQPLLPLKSAVFQKQAVRPLYMHIEGLSLCLCLRLSLCFFFGRFQRMMTVQHEMKQCLFSTRVCCSTLQWPSLPLSLRLQLCTGPVNALCSHCGQLNNASQRYLHPHPWNLWICYMENVILWLWLN